MEMNMQLNPGPRDDSVLYLGEEHRARQLFMNPAKGLNSTMEFKRGDASFWNLVYKGDIKFESKVLRYIRLAGFGGLLRCGYRRLDRALLEALMERWRPETNTFHLPFGEVTITLEDVNVLWGLPVDGAALSGVEIPYTSTQRSELCLNLLGFQTTENDFANGRKNMVRIQTILKFMMEHPVTNNSTEVECMQRARCVCLILAAKTVLADKNNAHASLHLLQNLMDIQTSGEQSWGGAALACLYRELEKGANPETRSMGGPMALLQIWAWTRILTLRPEIYNLEINKDSPYGARYLIKTLSLFNTNGN